MSLHTLLEMLIHHTTFRTENERHEALELLDAHVEPPPVTETTIARTDWRPKVATDAQGIPLPIPASAAEVQSLLEQNRQLIAMLQGMTTPETTQADAPDVKTTQMPPPMVTPAADMPAIEPVSPSDVPDGVT
jgi:hypothetical protein